MTVLTPVVFFNFICKAGPMKSKARNGCWSLWKQFLNNKLDSFDWFYKNFISIMGTLLMKVFNNNGIYALTKSFFNGQPVYCFKFSLRYMYHFIQLQTKTDTFILRNLNFVLQSFKKFRIPHWASIINSFMTEAVII